MSVGRICVRHVDVAAPNESTLIAAQRMQNRHVGTLVVVDQERRPQGILTDRDLVVQVLAQSRDPDRTHVGDVMSRLPTLVYEDTPIEEALAVMAQRAQSSTHRDRSSGTLGRHCEPRRHSVACGGRV